MNALIGLLPLALILMSDVWVYADSSRQAKQNQAVIFSSSLFQLRTPIGWLVACLIVWVVFFPLYLVARSSDF